MTTPLASLSEQSVFYLKMGNSARHWFQHLRNSSDDFHRAIEKGGLSGNLQHTAYASACNMYCRFFQGAPLGGVIREAEAALAFSQARHNQWAIELLERGLAVVGELYDEVDGTAMLGLELEIESESESAARESGVDGRRDRQVACIIHVLKSEASLLLGKHDSAWEHSELAAEEIHTVGTQGLLPWPEHVFTRALTITSLALDEESALDSTADDWRVELDRLTGLLHTWATHCPENYGHKHFLVEAERASLRGDHTQAVDLYDAAIASAREGEFQQWEGLANERAAALWGRLGASRLQQVYWQRAYGCYERWGAAAKIREMAKELQAEAFEAIQSARKGGGASGLPARAMLEEQSRLYAERQVNLLREQSLEAAKARQYSQAVNTLDELARAADALRSDAASGRKAATKLRALYDAEHAINQELERRVKERTADLKQTADELREANATLETMEERFRATIESAPLAMVMVDLEGEIVLVNAETEKLFGYHRDELLGQTVELLMPKRFHDGHRDHRAEYSKAPTPRRMGEGRELVGLRKDGVEIPLELGLSVVETAKNVFVLSTIADIAARKEAEAQMREANDSLESSNRELEQFAYIASHDLQEPLRKVASYCQLVKEGQWDVMDDEGREFLDIALIGAHRLQQLVRDLLALSRVTTRGKPLTDTDASASLSGAIEALSITIEERNAVLTFDPLPRVLADSQQLTRLFQNLISNAIKYCSRPVPQIHIGFRELERPFGEKAFEPAGYEFYVKDNGIGIEEQFHERIFEVFQRLHNRRQYSGTGIGLAICKRIVRRWEGEIRVESIPDVGSTFLFTIQGASPED